MSYASFRAAYGEYNDVVQQVASEQNQHLVNWDFECAACSFLTSYSDIDPLLSSGDSAGKNEDEINGAYDGLVQQHPGTILALNHEVQGESFHPFILMGVANLLSIIQSRRESGRLLK